MKICFYSPYIPDHFGGGEKYLLDLARYSAKLGHEVFIAVPSKSELSSRKVKQIRNDYERFLGTNLTQLNWIATPLGTNKFFLSKIFWTKQFDSLVYLTDGSLFLSLAKHNILHIQFPFKLDKSGIKERIKLGSWQTVTTNSIFTKEVVEPSWPIEVDLVHYPLIDTAEVGVDPDAIGKEKTILHVGRFFRQLHSKRQDILVDIFKRMRRKYSREMKDWQLVLIGSVEDEEYAQTVKQMAKNLPIKILHDVSRKELIDWYQRSSLYWHATGYRINQEIEPEKVEHFGITTVEAMAAGCVPVVIGKGGQLEIVGSKLDKFTWLTKRDCVKNTIKLIRDQELRHDLSHIAVKEAKKFDLPHFKANLKTMLNSD